VIAQAEYPLAIKRWVRVRKMSDEERRRIYEEDWAQYNRWLTGSAAV